MKLLPARSVSIGQEYIDSWRVTVAHYEHDNGYGSVIYAGILQWELLRTNEGLEYGAFTWGIARAEDNKETI